MDEQKSIDEQIYKEKKKRWAIFVVILCLLTVTVTAYVYFTTFLAINIF